MQRSNDQRSAWRRWLAALPLMALLLGCVTSTTQPLNHPCEAGCACSQTQSTCNLYPCLWSEAGCTEAMFDASATGE
jgi:hypothetical protein